METVLYRDGTRYTEKTFNLEKDFADLIITNSKTLFGKKTIIIDAKKKIDAQFMGGAIPDAFLFDLSDPDDPDFYIVEIELAKHSFFEHIFPQITKFFAFYKNQSSQNELIEKLHTIITTDERIKEEFQVGIGDKEPFLFIKDMVESSQNILLIIDDEKKELPEIIATYTDTWAKMVKVAILKQYNSTSDSILTITPDFESIETMDITSETSEKTDSQTQYTEEYHLDRLYPEIKALYCKIKDKLSNSIPGLVFNPQRYYISLRKKKNFAYFYLKRKRIRIVVMESLIEVNKTIKRHRFKELSEGVQSFYRGECCEILIENDKNLEEVISLLKRIQR